MKKWGIFFVLIVLIILSLTLWTWMRLGLREYVGAILAIRALPAEQQAKIYENFWGTIEKPYVYGGILAGVNTKIIPSVWVWGRRGLQFFRTDEYSVYSYFSMCNEKNLQALTQNGTVSVDRSIETDLSLWKEEAKLGQFVTIMIASPENGGMVGNLREAKGHDWWGFIPGDIRKQCGK